MIRCDCGLTHEAADWRMLPFVGVQAMAGERLELRNCGCGSTRARSLASDESVCTCCGAPLGAGDVKCCADAVLCMACGRRIGLDGLLSRCAA